MKLTKSQQNKADIEIDKMMRFINFNHFSQRCKSRFNLDVDFDLYERLYTKVRREGFFVYNLTSDKKLYEFTYLGKHMWVLANTKHRLLLTVLIICDNYPVPGIVKKLNIPKKVFLNEVLTKLKILETASFQYNSYGKDHWFKERPGNYPEWVYHGVYNYVEKGKRIAAYYLIKDIIKTLKGQTQTADDSSTDAP